MKTIKSVITSAFMLLLCLTVQAQWAGEDKKVLREPDNSQTVTIGVPDGSADKCYEWSGPHIESADVHQPVIVVKPQDSVETYICTRTSSCGVEQDEVKVRMTDSVGIVSVTPLKDCYNSGDELQLSDFEIVTNPPGMQSLVTFSPSTVTNNAGAAEEHQTITFQLNYNSHTSTSTATVNVYNEGLGVSEGASVDFHKFLEDYKKVNAMAQKAEGFVNKLNSLAKGASPCESDLHLVLTLPTESDIHACCNGKYVEGYKLSLTSVDFNVSVDCYFPTSLSIPHVGGLELHVGASMGIKLGPLDFTFKGECSNITVPLNLYANISGGVRLSLLDPDLLSAELNLVGEGSTGVTWYVGDKIEWHPLDVTLKIVGKVTVLSFYTDEVDYVLFTYSFFN